MKPEDAATAPKPRDWTWPTVAAVFAAFWIVYLLVSPPAGFNDLDDAGPGTPVDYNWTLQDLDGAPVKFSDFQGKALFVNVWATWCGPCVAEMPSIARLASNPDLKGKVAFVCISTDDSVNAVRSFLRGKDWPMTILRARELPPVFLTEAIPATFLVGGDGRLAYARLGSADWDSPRIVKKLKDLAAAAPAG